MALNLQTTFLDAWRPLRGPFTRWPRTSDTVLAIVTLLITVIVSLEDSDQVFATGTVNDIPIAAYFVFAIASCSLIWRRSNPFIVQAMVLFASALSMALGYFDGPVIALMVSLYSAGRYSADDPWNYVGVGFAIVLVGISEIADVTFTVETAMVLLAPFILWYVGRSIRLRGDYVEFLRARATQLEREQDSESRRAVAEERARIARELHDVVAHRVSLMTVQAGAAATVVDDDPKAALAAMKAVEKEGRHALNEMRHLMGVLRPEAEVGLLGPQPGIADIPGLVENLEEAGLHIELELDVVQAELPARVDLSTYRIVQEALTNVLKHAGPRAQTKVQLRVDRHRVAIEVCDDGHRATILPGSGHGIVGMRERAELLGGSLDAGPRPDGGFQVIALLPIAEDRL